MQSEEKMRLREMERVGEREMGKHEQEQHKERKKERNRVYCKK